MESFFKKPAYVFIGSIVLALLILFTTLFHEYKTSADINNDEQLKDFIAQNIPLSLNKVIAKKIVSDKVYILYEFSSPEQKPGMIVLKKKTLLKNRYGFFLNSWS